MHSLHLPLLGTAYIAGATWSVAAGQSLVLWLAITAAVAALMVLVARFATARTSDEAEAGDRTGRGMQAGTLTSPSRR